MLELIWSIDLLWDDLWSDDLRPDCRPTSMTLNYFSIFFSASSAVKINTVGLAISVWKAHFIQSHRFITKANTSHWGISLCALPRSFVSALTVLQEEALSFNQALWLRATNCIYRGKWSESSLFTSFELAVAGECCQEFIRSGAASAFTDWDARDCWKHRRSWSGQTIICTVICIM